MTPGRLYVRNFMSIGEVDIDLRNKGLVLVSGENLDIESANSNGAGKSSLFEALLWCYLGETYRKVSADRVARLVNGKTAPGGCAVVHEVECNGTTYRISRFRKDKRQKNRVVFEQIAPQQVDLTQAKAPQTDEMILRTLGIHPEILQQTTLIGQGMPWKFTDLKDADRKRVMTEMLHLHVWDSGTEVSRKKALDVQREIEQAQAAIAVQEEQLEGYLQSLNLQKDALQRVQASPPADPKEIKNLEVEIQKSQEEVDTLIVSLHSQNTTLVGCNGYIQAATEKRKQIDNELQEVQSKVYDLVTDQSREIMNLQIACRESDGQIIQQQKNQKDAERMELDSKIHGVNEKVREAVRLMTEADVKAQACKSRIDELEKQPDTCPTCGRPGAVELAQVEIGRQRVALSTYDETCGKVREENGKNQTAIYNLQELLGENDKKNKELDRKMAEINTKNYPQVDTLSQEFDARKKAMDLELCEKQAGLVVKDELIVGLTANRETCQNAINLTRNKIEEHSTMANTRHRRLGELQALHSGWQAQIEAAQKAVVQAQEIHQERQQQVSMNKANKDELDRLKAHHDWLAAACKKIRSLSMDEALGFINERLRYYMDIFSDGEIQVLIRPETENVTGGVQDKIDITITTAGGLYQSGSGGEKRRIDLALYFALSDLSAHVYGSHVTVLVCDEIMDALDITGVHRCLDILRAKRETGLSVFLTSQRGEILRGVTDFDNWWIMRKVGGVSSLVDARVVA